LVYFDMAGFEGGTTALNCALAGIRPERLVFASDYPQDFTGVNTDTGKGMTELRKYIEAVRITAQRRTGSIGGWRRGC
jgi:aminocarboxymuconate-semialdehyde decarboxylase